ncbi:MAG: pilus assembly protein [Propionibacteriales bacterium]|nr:pilus assembly protein [Propionibacteriales bacterium]
MTGRRTSAEKAGEDGTVTAEAAVVLPIVAAFALALIWMLSVGIAKVETVDAARDAARALARGDDPQEALAIATRTAPPNARIDVEEAPPGFVTVTVAVEAKAPGWLLAPLPAVTVGSRASTLMEGYP